MRWVIGVDGGGTRTGAALADMAGKVWARTTGESTNPYLHPMEAVERNFRDLVDDLLRAVGGAPTDVAGVCLGLSGCDRPADKEAVEAMVHRVLPGARAIACNDALVALVGGCGELSGIVVISGTGSIAYGFTPDGRSCRSGGYGQWLGDEGSGHEIARRGLIAVMRAADGRGAPTALTELVFEHLGLKDHMGLMPWSREHGPDKAAVAALAPLVFEAASRGDAVALEIIDWAAEELALAAQAVARRLWPGGEPFNVVAAGSNFVRQTLLLERFRAALAPRCPSARVMLPRGEAAEGACTYALQVLRQQENVR